MRYIMCGLLFDYVIMRYVMYKLLVRFGLCSGLGYVIWFVSMHFNDNIICVRVCLRVRNRAGWDLNRSPNNPIRIQFYTADERLYQLSQVAPLVDKIWVGKCSSIKEVYVVPSICKSSIKVCHY
jgi:hypothetical protein